MLGDRGCPSEHPVRPAPKGSQAADEGLGVWVWPRLELEMSLSLGSQL